MAPRVALRVLPLALLPLLAGCGGGDPTAFASATDRTCRELTSASETLRTELVRAAGRTEAVAVSESLSRYARRVSSAADELAAVDPPAADRTFGRSAVRALRTHADAMRDASTAARRGRVGDALTRRLSTTAATAVPAIPGRVLADAEDCRATDG